MIQHTDSSVQPLNFKYTINGLFDNNKKTTIPFLNALIYQNINKCQKLSCLSYYEREVTQGK